jgi:hypothetical protein
VSASRESQDHVYYCDLNGGPSTDAWSVTYKLPTIAYTSITGVNAQGPIEAMDVVMSMTHEPPAVSCATSWPADQAQLTATIPAGIAPTQVAFSFIGLEFEALWFVHIHSD